MGFGDLVVTSEDSSIISRGETSVKNYSELPAVTSGNSGDAGLQKIRKYFTKWIRQLTNTTETDINEAALLAKVHRVMKSVKNKRGEYKENYLQEAFVTPVQTPAPPQGSLKVSEESKSEDKVEKVTLKLHERRKVVSAVRENVKCMKRKVERLQKKNDMKKLKLDYMETEMKCISIKLRKSRHETIHFKTAHLKKKQQCIRLNCALRKANGITHQLTSDIKRKDKDIKVLKEELAEHQECKYRIAELEKDLTQAHISIDYMQSLLNDNNVIQLHDDISSKYTNETAECIMNLTDLKVTTEKVGLVIKEVAGLCGHTVDRLPSATTVNRIVDSKLSISNKQVGTICKDRTNTTLYTDETRKYGKCIQTYVLTDNDQNSYILGLREMVDKSGKSTLNTLTDILDDISTYCHEKEEENEVNVGHRILCNVRDTMSDRASTEKHFNGLLEEYRCQFPPQVKEGWEDLSENERYRLTHMNNFFCGLHLLVGMADVCETSLKKFEQHFLNEKEIGSCLKAELKRYHKNESGTLRLIRTASKAFAAGQDEKNGVYLPWLTFLKTTNEQNAIVRFKHNRFNLLFSLAGAVFHHSANISHFLDNIHGATNNLLQAVSLDVKETMYLSGLKAFGLISKLISGPLWSLLEAPGHILDMNGNYKTLVDFLLKGSQDVELISNFIAGEKSPFDSTIGIDTESQSLFAENNSLNDILCPMLQALFSSMHVLLTRMVADHLPGGKMWEPSEQLHEETRSVLKHNKLPEFVFGQLDQLLRYRPNANLVTNESYLMYSHNKTGEWLAGLPEDEKEELLTNSRKEGKMIRKMFQLRLREIEARRIEIQEKRREELQERERKRIEEMEKMTNDICFYGLWQDTKQVEEGLGRASSETEKRTVLQAQLRFRKNVLQQKHEDKKIYNFTYKSENGRYVKLTSEELKENVIKLIQNTLEIPTSEREVDGVPLLVGRDVIHTFEDGIDYIGNVISVVPGFGSWYNIKYNNDEAIYAYNLQKDYMDGNLKIKV